jgi:localization factor PodJL
MKFGVPWSVKGIRPEARETAREAARRSGMSLGDWLNSVILEQAGNPDDYDDDEADSHELAAVNHKLDDLSRRIEHFARTGPAAYAPKSARREQGRDDSSQIADLINRLDRRLDQFVNSTRPVASPPLQPATQAYVPQYPPQGLPPVPGVRMPPALDMAVAEIAARQRALNGQPQPAAPVPQRPMAQPAPQPALMPMPTQDLSGLEDQLRRITNQIETLHRPGVEEAINALRGELGDISRALTDAMPRQAIDTIERQIQGLSQRITEGRQMGSLAGADAGALAGVEHGLAEVRDALRGLTPAENLVGFNDAVAGLAHKIDLIVAQKDPEQLHQLEHAITTLRDMASHVASTEAVSGLAQQVESLAGRVEHLAAAATGSDALNNLEHRISALADALAERSQSGGTVPPMLESLVHSLSDKIEMIQQSRGDNIASQHLEDQIVALVKRLDASDHRLGHLEAIERGLADLLVHIEEMRANKNSGAIRADHSPVVDDLKLDMARTQNALQQVNGTLGTLVDRLAMLENGMRGGDGRKRPVSDEEFAEARKPIGKVVARAVVDPQPASRPPVAVAEQPVPVAAPQAYVAPQPIPQPIPQQVPQQVQQPVPQQAPQPAPRVAQQPAPQPAAKRLPPAGNLPINPDLPPDLPLEPGSGPPKFRANPGARIAASEAALGGAGLGGASSASGKSGFIAAARRAANAAMQTATERAPPPADVLELEDPDAPSLRGKMMKRVKSLFIAASVVAVVVGGIQIAGNFFEFGKRDAVQTAAAPADDTTASTEPAAPNPRDPVNLALDPLAPAQLPNMTQSMTQASAPLAPAAGKTATGVPRDFGLTTQSTPSLLSAPALTMPPAAPKSDVTGSIPTPAIARPPVNLPTTASTGDRLPAAIGSTKLRSAAIAGDGAAAYEVALRFAEGRGVPASSEDAARWYEKAAAKGIAPAQFRYASLLEKGQGVKKDLVQARRLYLAAAAKGNGKAMHNLAVLYAEGADGKPDYVNAAQWFRKAARRGIADSQYNLGVLCARGLGTEKNAAEAYQWFSLAAAQGDKESAKKRDEISAHMDPEVRAAAERAVANFAIEPQPSDAISVQEPVGGWDGVSATTTPPHGKPRPVGPMSLGALETGKR